MKRKEIEKCLATLEKYKLDENKNWRPDIIDIIRLLQIKRLRRVGQRDEYLDNIVYNSSSKEQW